MVIIGFVLLAALFRWVPHPPNFTPIIGMALFSGWALSSRFQALLLPLFAMLISDAVLGFHDQMPAVYLSILLAVFIGPLAQQSKLKLAGSATGAALLFFILTNLAVWQGSGMYPLNGAGLISSYVAAIPFFGNTLISTLLSFAGLVWAYKWVDANALSRVAPVDQPQ